MMAVAIKKSSREKAEGLQEMGTLRCDGCGEEFFIGHNPVSGSFHSRCCRLAEEADQSLEVLGSRRQEELLPHRP